MLSRLNTNNENVAYPLAVDNTVYPDGLINDVHIISDTYDVFIDSITIINSTVSVLMSCMHDDEYIPFGYGSSSVHDDPYITIYSNTTDKAIGWLTLGSMINYSGSYSQRVPICKSCIFKTLPYSSNMTVNGITYTLQDSLNIIISGDLDYEYSEDTKEYIIRSTGLNSREDYDADSLDDFGPIISVNGVTRNDGVITIYLPVGHSEEFDSDVAIFTVDYFKVSNNTSGSITVISIKAVESASESQLAPFTCGSSDILLNKINTDDGKIGSIESPLADFVSWYKKQKYNGCSDDSSSSYME